MPILHTQLTAQGQTPDGTAITIPPAITLMQRGPVIQVTIGIEQNIAQQLLSQGIPLPEPVPGIALIDTGATSTCIYETVAQHLKLPVVDVVSIASVSHIDTKQKVYPVLIEVVGIDIKFNVLRAIGVPLSNQGIQILIGRD